MCDGTDGIAIPVITPLTPGPESLVGRLKTTGARAAPPKSKWRLFKLGYTHLQMREECAIAFAIEGFFVLTNFVLINVRPHSLPQLSCNPRGGFRPCGGTHTRSEIRDFHQDSQIRVKDEVVMIIHNIDQLWTDKDFEDFLRPLMVFTLRVT